MGGARLLSKRAPYLTSLVGGYLYSCDDGHIRATPTSGGPDVDRGPCSPGQEFEGDARDTFFCDDRGIMRLPSSGPAVQVAAVGPCLLETVDDNAIYYTLSSIDVDRSKAGLYRIARTGGAPVKLLASAEEATATSDGNDLWFVLYEAGRIERLPKRGGKPVIELADQPLANHLVIDGDMLYWSAKGAQEIRKRAKRGGPVRVVAEHVDSRWFVVHAGALYWFAGQTGERQQLVRRGPNEAAPTTLVTDLVEPQMQADANGVYFSEISKPGIYALQ